MSYAIPESVKKMNEYDTEILDMDIDDPNHFAPNYFGRGYRWHDPNVDKMEEAYKEAEKVTKENGVTIYHATIGGKCEVFERVDYYSLFSQVEGGNKKRVGSKINEHVDFLADQRENISEVSENQRFMLTSSIAYASVTKEINTEKTIYRICADINETCYLAFQALANFEQISSARRIDVNIGGMDMQLKAKTNGSCVIFWAEITAPCKNVNIRIACPDILLINNELKDLGLYATKTCVNYEFPLSSFDGQAYLEKYPDVAKLVSERKCLSGLRHYQNIGMRSNYTMFLALDSDASHGWRFQLE